MKGLLLHLLRPVGYPDCTNGGVSAKHDSLILVGTYQDGELWPLPRGSQVFEVDDEHPAVVMVESKLKGALPHLVPFGEAGRHRVMFGGNYASGDSRFGDLVEKIFDGPRCVSALPVHDRFE